ncbi:relaxase/mobilization nuclease domain-containing protein [Rhodoplanes sp. Z2-YC6860]|uniref:relaxase/mobilization nuclease domain-containing protein n=1 Tax=Rhodoplanes sp. Z2-YC6860 TaxID=674703 RepID=UPI00078DC89C|nr:relaxase/mobilization nuclease domain-containing protein [Rhodoplanes sp. Z2-YC6860]AMN40492.1 Ti-type conjugative transfer relaxase TraA [Rhodoplanes sp. Z2-YC6860]
MILKGSQRGGPIKLAAHLLNDRDNHHVTLHEVRGFVSSGLVGAMAEASAVSKGTRSRQPVFSLSLNPPKDEIVPVEAFLEAADRAEAALGLSGQPRAIVFHEKNGRRHAHVVWSRIDAKEMKAINLPYFKTRLNALSKELYLQHEWDLPEGHRENGWKSPLNFTLAEWQQAKRHDLDPREIKQVFQNAWARSDNLASFRSALDAHGYILAKGDRRGFVAVDIRGEVYPISRWSGVKTKDLSQRLGDASRLLSVTDARSSFQKRMTGRAGEILSQDRAAKAKEIKPLLEELRILVSHHRKERALLNDRQAMRRREEVKERSGRFRRGLGALLDLVTGRMFTVRRQTEREAFECFVRDRTQQEALIQQQGVEKRGLVQRIAALQQSHRAAHRQLLRQVLVFTKYANRVHARDGLHLQ